MKTIKAFNANTQAVEEATITVDANKELVVRFKDNSFFKLPAGMSDDEIVEHLDVYHENNLGQEKVVEETEEEVEEAVA